MPLSALNTTAQDPLANWQKRLDALQPPAPGYLPVAIRSIVSLCRIVFEEERKALAEYSSYLAEGEQRAQAPGLNTATRAQEENTEEREALCAWLIAAMQRRAEAVRFLRNAHWEERQIKGLYDEDEQAHIRLKALLNELDVQLRSQYLVWMSELVALAHHEVALFTVEIIPTVHSLAWEE